MMRIPKKIIASILLVLLTQSATAQVSVTKAKPGNQKVAKVVPSAGAIYAYEWQHPNTGFRNPDGSDSMVMHFPHPEKVNFAATTWHKEQLESMMEAGLDFVLPSFRFDPIHPENTTSQRSITGLKAMTVALQQIVKSGGQPPLVGMYLETSFLAKKTGGRRHDLKGQVGVETIQTSIFKFFDLVAPHFRFTMSGFPVIVVDTTHGVLHDRDLFEHVADAFLVRYKVRPWIVADRSWHVRSTAHWQKGAALYGPQGGNEVSTLGPGYDDTHIPKRGTPVRKREETRFYQWSWNKILLSNPTLVIIESWNDFSAGTGIADSQEYGTRYLDLTRRFIGRMKNRILPDMKKPVRLAHPDPIPRPDKGWWQIQGVRDRVFFVAKEHRSDFGYGLRLARVDDGPFLRTKTAGTSTVTPVLAGKTENYLYFGVADEFAYRVGGSYEVEVILHPSTKGLLHLQYDSWDRSAAVQGSYKSTPPVKLEGPSSKKNRAIFTLPDPRFGNRQNGGSDFRLAFRGDNFAIIGIQVRRLPKKMLSAKASATLR